MYCTVCGHENLDDARFCTECGSPQRDFDTTQVDVPRNYLTEAILVTICCCLPAGIVAIVLAVQVNGKVARGDMQGALESSHNARTWCWISFGLGIALVVIFSIYSRVGQ